MLANRPVDVWQQDCGLRRKNLKPTLNLLLTFYFYCAPNQPAAPSTQQLKWKYVASIDIYAWSSNDIGKYQQPTKKR